MVSLVSRYCQSFTNSVVYLLQFLILRFELIRARKIRVFGSVRNLTFEQLITFAQGNSPLSSNLWIEEGMTYYRYKNRVMKVGKHTKDYARNSIREKVWLELMGQTGGVLERIQWAEGFRKGASLQKLSARIDQLLDKHAKKGIDVAQVIVGHTHPSLEAYYFDSSGQHGLLLHPLGNGDLYTGECLASFFQLPITVTALTASGITYSITF